MHKIIFLFFFCSGFSALVYEVAWVRILSLTLGNTVYASSTVLAVFMGGLSLGAFLGGKWSDRYETGHLKLYGYIELLVGFLAPLITLALTYSPGLYANFIDPGNTSIVTLTAFRLILSAALLLLPCMLMGATLPVLIRYVREHQSATEFFASLYGINTIGAAAGALFTCFLGFAYIGLNSTILLAALGNLFIGLASIRLDKSSKLKPIDGNNEIPGSNDNSLEEQQSICSAQVLMTLSLLTGFTALAYEVVWTRILTYYLSSLTYTFSLMVSIFLLGLAFGSFLFHRFFNKPRRSAADNLMIFAGIQYAAAIVSTIALFTSGFADPLRKLWLNSNQSSFVNMPGHLAWVISVSVVCLLPLATTIGILFPYLGTLAASDDKRLGSSVGKIYAANTIGCVLGSTCAGLLLIPGIGWFASYKLLILISLLCGVIAAAASGRTIKPIGLVGFSLPLLASILFLIFVHSKPVVNPTCKLLFHGEDALGTITIVDDPKLKGKTLVFNGSCLATTLPNSLRYMRMLGHLPMLLHPSPKTALLGCFGTGSTAGAVALHPNLEKLQIVELSPMILQQNKLFRQENYDVIGKKNVQVQINDVRNFLLCSKSKYDVITFEPPPPSFAGVVNLYTCEFYDLAMKHLNKNGLLCQWVPMDCGSKKLWKMMVYTACTVFPYVSVWLPNSHEGIILASTEPIIMDFSRMQSRIDETPEIAANLKEVGLDDAMAIASTYVVSGKELNKFLDGCQEITDDHPRLEFFLPYAGNWITDLELESPGRAQLEELFLEAQRSKAGSFNAKSFREYYAALHLLREAQNADPKYGQACIDKALEILPNNVYFQWIKENSDLAVAGKI